MRNLPVYISSICAAEIFIQDIVLKWAVFLVQTTAVTFFIYRTAGCFLKVKNKTRARVFLAAACAILGGMVILLADMANLPPTLLFFMWSVWMSCEGSGFKRLTMGLIIAGTVFTYNALIDSRFSTFYPAQSALRCLSGLVLYSCARRFAPERDFELSRPLWRILLLLTAAPVGIVLCLVLLSQYDQIGNDVQNLTLLFLALFSFAGLLGTTAVLARQKELEEAQTLLEMNRKYYKAMEEQNFEIRRMKHDLSNHLQTILSLPEGEKDSYVKQLLENPIAYKTMRYCADETVNIVLSVKASVMEGNKIPFQVKADIPVSLPMEKPDICAIFGNALDNAAEAVKRIPEPERYICLETRFAKGMFVLRIENSCLLSGENFSEKFTGQSLRMPQTTKSDRSSHGYGLRSIGECVKKYGGEITVKTEEGKFILFLYISNGLYRTGGET